MRSQHRGFVSSIGTLRGLASVLLGGLLAFGGATPSFAAVTQGQAPGSTDAKAQAQALYKEGVTLYKMSEYQAALEQFKQAFKFSMKIEDEEVRARVLHALEFNLARAHVKTYGIDRDIQHLRVAVDLLEKHAASSAEYGVDAEAEDLLTYAQAELARPAGQSRPVDGDDEGTSKPAEEADPKEDRDAVAEDAAPEPLDDRNRPSTASGKALRISGYVALGLGAASLGLMGGGMAMAAKAKGDYEDAGTQATYDCALSRGTTGNALALTGAVAAGVFLSAGAVLLVVEKKKKPSRASRAARLRLGPQMGRDGGGVWLKGAF